MTPSLALRHTAAIVFMAIWLLASQAARAEDSSAPPWLRFGHQNLFGAVGAEFQRAGASPVTSIEDRLKRCDWLITRDDEVRESIRTVAYDLLKYRVQGAAEPDRHTLRFFYVEAMLNTTRSTATHMTSLELIPYYRREGWPRPRQSAWGVATVFDGRRLMSVQFPPLGVARPSRDNPARWAVNTQVVSPGRITGEATGGTHQDHFHSIDFGPDAAEPALPYELDERDILLSTMFLSEGDPKYSTFLDEGRILNASDPMFHVHDGVGSAQTMILRQRLAHEGADALIGMWESDSIVAIALSNLRDARPNVVVYQYERPSGLMTEMSACTILVDKKMVGGLTVTVSNEDVLTDEGATFRLPSSKIEYGVPPPWLLKTLGADVDSVAEAMAYEDSVFVHYHRVNAKHLERPEHYDINAVMTRLGIRVSREAKVGAEEFRFTADSVIFGPPEIDLGFPGRWDGMLRTAIDRCALPIGREHVLSFAELMARRSASPEIWHHFDLLEDGTIRPLRPSGIPYATVQP